VAAVCADPISSTDLASATEWSYKKEHDNGWQTIAVPAQLSVKNSADRWIDYKRQVSIPPSTTPQATVLRLLSVNDGGEVYLDDRKVATVNYGLFPVEIDLTHFVVPGRSYTLTVRCFSRNHYYPPGTFPQDNNGEEFLGIPRGVFLDTYPVVHIADAYVRSSVADGTLAYDLWIANESPIRHTLTIAAALSPWNPGMRWSYPAIPDQTVRLSPNSVTKVSGDAVRWNLGPPSYWWPNIPFQENYQAILHNLRFTLTEGATSWDNKTQRFGFADYSEGPDYYRVNGVRIFQFEDSTQEHMWSPSGLDGFQTSFMQLEGWGAGPNGAKETWRRYLRLGINSFRLHSSAADETMLDAADEVGFMLTGESGIRGYAKPEETWDPLFKPAAEQAMARAYRNHPSIVRYSLDNEWAEATKNEAVGRGLIDAIVVEDSRRLLSFSQDKEPWVKKVLGSDGVHDAWALQHYHQPPPQTDQIAGVEEDLWDRHGTGRNELIGCAKAAVVDRQNNYVVFSPWTLNNYWCNFVAGGSKSTGTVNPIWRNKDRHDGIDGWGSNIVRFVQNCYSIFASCDIDLIEHHLNTEDQIFDSNEAVSFENKDQVTRQMVMFNNSLSSHLMSVAWEAHLDSADGLLTAAGETGPVRLGPGEHANPIIDLPLPGTGSDARTLFFVVKTKVDGTVRFSEDRYFFKVKNAGRVPSAPAAGNIH
jgi:hypothetical protein